MALSQHLLLDSTSDAAIFSRGRVCDVGRRRWRCQYWHWLTKLPFQSISPSLPRVRLESSGMGSPVEQYSYEHPCILLCLVQYIGLFLKNEMSVFIEYMPINFTISLALLSSSIIFLTLVALFVLRCTTFKRCFMGENPAISFRCIIKHSADRWTNTESKVSVDYFTTCLLKIN